MKYALSITLLALMLYVGAYFAALSLPSLIHFRQPTGPSTVIETKHLSINGELVADYHGIPGVVFAPIHALDKKYLRHSYWFTPRDQPQSFDWLLGQMPSASKTP